MFLIAVVERVRLQTRMRLSALPVTSKLPGPKANAGRFRDWASIVSYSPGAAVAQRHRRTRPSRLAAARIAPLGANASSRPVGDQARAAGAFQGRPRCEPRTATRSRG